MERRSLPRSGIYLFAAVFLTLLAGSFVTIYADSISTNFESYATGTVNGQNGCLA